MKMVLYSKPRTVFRFQSRPYLLKIYPRLRPLKLKARFGELIELAVDDVPLSIDNFLEFLWAADPHLGIILLSLKLKLNVQDGDHWIFKLLWLLLETGV